MVLGHCFLTGVPRQFIYAFHMPAFFIISGYLYKQHNWKRTTVAFGCPVVFYLLLNLSYYVLRQKCILHNDIDWSSLLIRILPPLIKNNNGEDISLFTGLWFIEVLYLIRLFLGDVKIFSFIREKYVFVLPFLIFYNSIEPLLSINFQPLKELYAYKILTHVCLLC